MTIRGLGNNGYGQLGTGEASNYGGGVDPAYTTVGLLYCWGTNQYGQIGHRGVVAVGIDERADTFEPVSSFE